MHNAPVADGAHYVASYREGGLGRADIWHVTADGAARPLGPPINDAGGQSDLWVSPDGTWMILVITEPEGGLGGDDLLVSSGTVRGRRHACFPRRSTRRSMNMARGWRTAGSTSRATAGGTRTCGGFRS